MKKIGLWLALAGTLLVSQSFATSLDDIQFWTGTGTNRAALVIYWNAPEVRNNTSVPDPAAEKSLVWGYRFNGTATAEDMFNAVVAADHRLFVTATTPYSGFGAFIYSIGYDLNNNGVFGIRIGTNTFAENAFTNGQRVFTTEDVDSAQPLDAADLFWSGSFGANWEMWQEHGGMGGFTNAPDRGPTPYWTPLDTDYFSYGYHGQWDYAGAGLEGTPLHDGSWIGFTISAGGLNYLDPEDPGTVAYDYHKHAPVAPEPAVTNSSYAAQIVASQGPFGNSPYDDPNSALGAPTTRFYEGASKPATRVKLIEAAYNYSIVDGVTNKLLVTMNTGSSIIAKFDHPVYDNSANPYGIDFEVFGNAFYSVVSGGFSSDTANMNNFILGTGVFSEPTKVSVSPGYTGQLGENPNDPSTWPWYRYDDGPYDDTDFPTHAYRWNRDGTNWTDEVMDFTKPVNPVMRQRFSDGGLTAPEGIDLYDGSGGGTGFDLKPSGFTSIQYVKVEGLSGFTGGEVDSFSVVRPMTIGDTLSISPANLTNGSASLFFQKPGEEGENVLSLSFTNVSEIAQVATRWLGDPVALAALPGKPLNTVQLGIGGILDSNAVIFQADLALSPGVTYKGNGDDLRVFAWDGTNWNLQPFTFTNSTAVVSDVTNLSAFAIAQFSAPPLQMQQGTTGFTFQFTPVAHCEQVLERSTNLVAWAPVTMITPANTAPVMLTDSNAPAGKAFYRLRLNLP